ncbi:MAG: kinase-like domain-containing protein [Piptocephalis tieghemiana]|nr:MAG: kinase-like domain-containing protein [Piptocephalis tieghemiana]
MPKDDGSKSSPFPFFPTALPTLTATSGRPRLGSRSSSSSSSKSSSSISPSPSSPSTAQFHIPSGEVAPAIPSTTTASAVSNPSSSAFAASSSLFSSTSRSSTNSNSSSSSSSSSNMPPITSSSSSSSSPSSSSPSSPITSCHPSELPPQRSRSFRGHSSNSNSSNSNSSNSNSNQPPHPVPLPTVTPASPTPAPSTHPLKRFLQHALHPQLASSTPLSSSSSSATSSSSSSSSSSTSAQPPSASVSSPSSASPPAPPSSLHPLPAPPPPAPPPPSSHAQPLQTTPSPPTAAPAPPSPVPSRPSSSAGSSHKSPSVVSTERAKSLKEAYGRGIKLLGSGTGGTVRLFRVDRGPAGGGERTYAVKEFRKPTADEDRRRYMKRLTAEYCIASALHHENVIETLDMIFEGPKVYTIMEYCPHDLYHLLSHPAGPTSGSSSSSSTAPGGGPSHAALQCYWKQLVRGVKYLHEAGLVHRDLKLENVVVSPTGRVKIIDFGSAEVVRCPWETEVRPCRGLRGSDPYVAPEVWHPGAEFSGAAADAWAVGIIWVCMLSKKFPWAAAKDSDPGFRKFLNGLADSSSNPSTSTVWSKLLGSSIPECRTPLSNLLTCDWRRRWSMSRILDSPWMKSVVVCGEEPEGSKAPHHHHYGCGEKDP